jgi:hypothetical protein
LFQHDLFGKLVSTFRDHALAIPAQLEAGECGVSEDESSLLLLLCPYGWFRQKQIFVVMNDQ